MKKTYLRLVFLGAAIFALSSCKVVVPESAILKCDAVPDKTIVESDEVFNVVVTASGGAAPYELIGQVGEFDSSTSVERSFNNESGADTVVSKTMVVKGKLGVTAQCGYSVTVHSADITDPTPVPAPKLTVSVDPGTSVAADVDINVTVSSEDIDDAVYTFDFVESGVNMVRNSATMATFSNGDGLAHSFVLTVKVTGTVGADDITLTDTVTLGFAAEVSIPEELNCVLTHSGTKKVGKDVVFTVQEIGGSDRELVFTQFTPGVNGYVTANAGDELTVQYTSTGTKAVKARAVLKSDPSIKCNEGDILTDSVVIDSTLTCAAYTDYKNYRVYYGPGYPPFDGQYYNSVITWAVVSGASAGITTITDLAATSTNGFWVNYPGNPLAKEVYFREAGTMEIDLTVKDGAGNTAKCSTSSFRVWQ